MKIAPSVPVLAGVLLLALPAAEPSADVLEGTVLAYDRQANVIVLEDKSVMPLEKLEGEMPADLVAGERIEVSFESNEDDGIYVVHHVKRMD